MISARRPLHRHTLLAAAVLLSAGLIACSSDGGGARSPSSGLAAATAPDNSAIDTTPSTTITAPASTTPTTTSTTTTTTTTTTTIAVPTASGPLDLTHDIVGLGFSAGGRPIFAERYGTPGGRRVLVIGVIHGDEDDGLAIVDELRRRDVPDGVELWIVESMNPDGQAAQDRHNDNDVDLNRNFPYKWGTIGVPGDGQYAGTGPASEPETQAITNFISQLRPDIALWYHQDLFVINPAQGREGRVRARYAELASLPMGEITGGTYTGIAATWARQELSDADGVAFIVELGATLSPEEAATHADAVLTIAVEG
ncbi:MAG: M14 family zinc carboxypeptidase [Ilumatobacteraceae bacterium]